MESSLPQKPWIIQKQSQSPKRECYSVWNYLTAKTSNIVKIHHKPKAHGTKRFKSHSWENSHRLPLHRPSAMTPCKQGLNAYNNLTKSRWFSSHGSSHLPVGFFLVGEGVFFNPLLSFVGHYC